MRRIRQLRIKRGQSASELALALSGCAFGARQLGRAAELLKTIVSDRRARLFVGLAGAMVPAGMRSVIVDMLRSGAVEVLVSTGANLTHDLVESLGISHLAGSADVDDASLRRTGLDRIYDAYMPDSAYVRLHSFFNSLWPSLGERCSGREFLWAIGRALGDKDSILSTCARKKVALYCPALPDSGIGLAVWARQKAGRRLEIDLWTDLAEMMSIAFEAKKAAVLYIGGGVPKNYIQQALQWSPRGAAYAIQITTDRVESGGSSGAALREGISWGKLGPRAQHVDLRCDATIALPLIWAAAKEALARR